MATPAPVYATTSLTLDVPPAAFDKLATSWLNLGKQFTLALIPVADCSALGTIPGTVSFTGFELLWAVGRACSKPDVLEDATHLFALFKYADAIATSPQFRLREEVGLVDTRKKAVLSEDFGCGASLLVANRCFGAKFFLDFSTAVKRGWLTHLPKSRRPDYIGMRTSGASELILLEAKGTTSGQRYCWETQIPSGCDQLSQVGLPADSQKSIQYRVVVGMALQLENEFADTNLYIGDPVSKGPYEFDFTKGSGIERTVVKCHYARVASLIGDEQLASALYESRVVLPVTQVSRRIRGRSFTGTVMRVVSGKRTIILFAGIDNEVRALVMEGAPTENIVQAVLASSESMTSKDQHTLYADGRDGTVLTMTIEELPEPTVDESADSPARGGKSMAADTV